MSLKADLDKLGKKLLNAALEPEARTDSAIDIFKAVSAYHLGSQKITKPRQPEDESVTFDQLVGKLKPTQPGGHA